MYDSTFFIFLKKIFKFYLMLNTWHLFVDTIYQLFFIVRLLRRYKNLLEWPCDTGENNLYEILCPNFLFRDHKVERTWVIV